MHTLQNCFDLQVNGFGGTDFSHPGLSPESFAQACDGLRAAGTERFLATVITSSDDTYRAVLPVLGNAIASGGSAAAGVHLEGPFISGKDGFRGAHSREHVRAPDTSFLETLFELSRGTVRLLTLAAECEGACRCIEHAASLGIAVSLGHQDATIGQLREAVSAGARALTHLGNGMPQASDRHRNALLAGLAVDELAAMIIADGHHLPPELITTIIRVKGEDNVILTSDASPLAGMPPGAYRSMGQKTILEDSGRLYNPDTGYLVGSSATLARCITYCTSQNICSAGTIRKMAVDNPERLSGVGQTK
ncbi:MAG: N-acetylglucosamine-6-phosphate deacetylase [Chitinivibrionales bacterium]|nr:N-acetylglucosamine-6-phosphate deacetylase [Chitinivibrionales bacterium]MBD3396053.1 N-acetylglucosamine-6-phosphate deacetylase [Chitinivibrionales bacterium]